VFGELVQIVHFKCEMRQIGADDDRSAIVELTDLNFLIAARRFEKDELRPAPGGLPANLLKAEDVLVKRDRFLQVMYAIARVQ
jgi:hypothetical protein